MTGRMAPTSIPVTTSPSKSHRYSRMSISRRLRILTSTRPPATWVSARARARDCSVTTAIPTCRRKPWVNIGCKSTQQADGLPPGLWCPFLPAKIVGILQFTIIIRGARDCPITMLDVQTVNHARIGREKYWLPILRGNNQHPD
jgi:hypothetical protein